MTEMPQMVALLNGARRTVGAGRVVEFFRHGHPRAGGDRDVRCVIGAISFWGSMVAWAKLQGVVSGARSRVRSRAVNLLLFLGRSP